MREVALDIPSEEFKRIGHRLVDEIAEFFESLSSRPVTRAENADTLRSLLPPGGLPASGEDAAALLSQVAPLLFDHSLFNAHPRFAAYITSPAAPIGVLADFLAAAVNPNLGAAQLAPIATEIELQTVAWIAEMIGYPADCGGLLVSGGNMANFVCLLAARRARADWDLRKEGVSGGRELVLYTSKETHTWVQKAADLFGLGTKSIRWISTDSDLRMDVRELSEEVGKDRAAGRLPFLAVGTAGSVSTGAVDPLRALAEVCRENGLWFHVDGAYGALAAVLPDASDDLRALSLADSIAVDPHKWLYAPLEAGCVLVRERQALLDAFAYRPPYYHFNPHEEATNFFELGPQNSRGFRALKVWLGLRQAGRKGYQRMISDDIALARVLFERTKTFPELEAFTCALSIATFRFVPKGFAGGSEAAESYLNDLNTLLLTRLQESGEAYLSNAVVGGKFLLRACVVNFRTTEADVEAIPEIVVRIGREADLELRAKRGGEGGIQAQRETGRGENG